MIDNVIIKNNKVEVILANGSKMFLSLTMAAELREHLNEIL